MRSSIEVKKSFFLRFLLWTVFLGNVYLLFQSVFHSLNIHGIDDYFRWYAFNTPPLYNLLLVVSSTFTLLGAYAVYMKGKPGFRIYFFGKLLAVLALFIITKKEYELSGLDYPYILLPILVFIELLYPMIISISLRKVLRKQAG